MSTNKINNTLDPHKVQSARFGGGKDFILRAWHWNVAKTSFKGTNQGWYLKLQKQVTQMKNAGYYHLFASSLAR